jgi:serine-type D-Ala-D-Ala carboxypeptidase (penicillin-binding protein 5/6)
MSQIKLSLIKSVCRSTAIAVACLSLNVAMDSWAAPPNPDKPKPAKPKHHAAPQAATGGPGIGADGMPTFDTEARFAVVIDYNSGVTLLDKNADQHMPTASMSKIMTMYQVGLDLKAGKAKPDDMLPVSEEAWKTGGSKMFVPYPGQVKVSDLLRGVMIQSGNDACVVLAEGLAGSTAAFVAEMNATAKKLGLTNSHFTDVDGLPDPDHYMSPRDLVQLSEDIIRDFPDLYKLASEKEFTYNNIKQGNRNPLLYKNIGADGVKTGHTDEAGYGLVGSAVRNGRRIIVVIAGLPSMKARDQESERLMEWAFRAYDDVTVAHKGGTIDEAPVWLGDKATVPVATEADIVMTVPRGPHKNLKVTAVYDGQIKAPVTAGEKVGELRVALGDGAPINYPLVAMAPVEKMGPMARAAEGIAQYIWEKKH